MNLLLTGATGLLGGELLVNLAARPEIERIQVLARPRDGETAIARLRAVFAVHGDHFDPDKIRAIDGDLLDAELPQRLSADAALTDVDVVLHAAANTSFLRINDARVEATNVGALERLVRWARRLPRLQTFAYVGTAMICGTAPRPGPVGEDESPDPTVSHLVRYTESKLRAELMLHRELPADRVLVMRPSIIMGDSRPVIPRSPLVLWAMAAMNHLRLVATAPDAPLDIIPVDYAADAIAALLLARRDHRTYHIATGTGAATSTRLLADLLARQFPELPPFRFVRAALLPELRRWLTGAAPPDHSELVAHASYLAYWQTRFRDARRLRAVFAALEPYLKFMALGHVFDNARLLATTGLRAPDPAHVYMASSLHHLAAIDIIGGARET